MSAKHTTFDGSIPDQYDKYLGPLIFEFSAKDMAERVSTKIPAKSQVLEVACGTGISTEYLRNFLPETTSIIATDLVEAMLAVARKKRGSLPNVEYKVADAQDLPFEDERFDAVVCQFGIMFFPDKLKGLSEMVRVAKPGSLIAFNVWDSVEHNKVFKVVQDVVENFFESDPPEFLKVPFGYYDIEQIKELMHKAELTKIESHIVSATTEDFDAHHIAEGCVTGNPTITEINERAHADSATIVDAAAAAIEKTFGSKKPKLSFQEIVFTGIKSA